MKVHNNIDSLPGISNPIVTIGTFDGVHLAHQQILARLKEMAMEIKGETVVVTFEPHPRSILNPSDTSLRLINSLDEKIDLLEKYGVDHLIIIEFTKEFSENSATQFVETIISGKLNTYKLVIGYDHHFGKDREGNFEFLKKVSSKYGFELEEISKQTIDNVAVSSTAIRESLLVGDVKSAEKLLGHPFTLLGKVIKGDQVGQQIGFPTANLDIQDPYKLYPEGGVYAVQIHWRAKDYMGMLNIGFRPTRNGDSKTVEVNIFDFNDEIYGEELKLTFLEQIRKERKFDNLESLKNQLILDREKVLKMVNQ